MSSINEDVLSSVSSFNGVLDQYVHVSPSKKTTPRTATPSPLKRSLEREENSDELDPSAQQASPTTTTRRRITRSQSAQLLQQPTKTTRGSIRAARTSPTKRTRSSRSTPSTPNDASQPAPNNNTPTNPHAGPVCRLRDTIPPGLILLFIGVNPGIMTGQTGFVYAHPSNLYWKLLHSSGITTLRHPPSDTYRLPELYNVGNTNIVARPTRDASMLSKEEMLAGVPVLESKIRKSRPEAVALVGKSIWEAVWRVRRGRNMKKEEFRYGWQDESENMGVVRAGDAEGEGEEWKGARVFVATTTSGLAASMSIWEKQAVWNELGKWVKQRREETGFVSVSN